MTDHGRSDTYRLDSDDFRRYLMRLYHREKGSLPAPAAVAYVVEFLHASVPKDDEGEPVFLRVATRQSPAKSAAPEQYLLDLADRAGRVVSIGPDGWEVTPGAGVHFWRPSGLGELPLPARGAAIDLLNKYVNLQEFQFPVLVAWLTAALRPAGPYPILVIEGEQGVGKTTLTEVCRHLVDPHVALVRSMPRIERELMLTAQSNWLVAFDNVSAVSAAQSDALSRLSTGGGYATRERSTDLGEIVIDIERPIIVNGTGEFMKRPDVVDRCIFLRLPPLSPKKRRHDQEFWAEFHRDLPNLLGALLAAAAGGLKHQGEIQLKELSRMADFDRWGAAVAQGLGWPQGKFVDNYRFSRRPAGARAIEQVPVFLALAQILKRHRRWACTPKDLLRALDAYKRLRWPEAGDWPASPAQLLKLLHGAAEQLRSEDIGVSFRQMGDEPVVVLERLGDMRERSAS